MNKRELKECFMELAKNANLAACATEDGGVINRHIGRRETYRHAANLIDQLDEPEKVVVPDFVGEWIESLRYSGLNFYSAYEYAREFKKADDKVRKWFNSEENLELFARAWLDGYTVEGVEEEESSPEAETLFKIGEYMMNYEHEGSIGEEELINLIHGAFVEYRDNKEENQW